MGFDLILGLYLIIAGFFMAAFDEHVEKKGRKFHPVIIAIVGLFWFPLFIGAIFLRLKPTQQ